MVEISKDIPAGNIEVLNVQCDRAFIAPELRDSRNDWFYWKFKAVFDAPGKMLFRFSRPHKIGARGPAVSTDRGASWSWRPEAVLSDCDFVHECRRAGEEVWFCQGLPYLQADLARFIGEFRDHPALHLSSLCRSRKGREVESLEIREGAPPLAVVLTARHHCQEMSGSMVLEGVLRHVLTDAEFRRRIAVYAVPFVDKDGAEDGDQGKGRIPRDHARDYDGNPIYPETAAVWKLIAEKKPFLVLDLHSPWIKGQHNENPYLVENRHARFAAELKTFSEMLEREAPACAPFSAADTIHWGTAWNTDANFKSGVGSGGGLNLATACGDLPFVRFASTIEIPFANFGNQTVTYREFLKFGDAVARVVMKYADQQKV